MFFFSAISRYPANIRTYIGPTMKDLLCPVCGGGLPFRFCKVGVRGNVHVKGKIEIKKDGSVIGDLTTAQIIIEDGAYFKGSIEIDRSADKEGDNTVFLADGVHTDYASGSGRRAEECLITKE